MAHVIRRFGSRTNERADLRTLSTFLDSQFRLPGGWRVGWDGILGFIPGVGDLVTTSMSFYILARAAALGCPPSLLMRMGLNIGIDTLLDAIPLLGNFFDFIFKSNLKNLRLIEDYMANPRRTTVASRFAVGLTLAFLAAILLGAVIVAVLILGAIVEWLRLNVF